MMVYSDDIVHSYERRLCDLNYATFFRSRIGGTQKVLIIHTLPRDLDFCELEDIVAMKVEGRTEYYSIQCGEYRKSVELLDKSFGITPLYWNWNKESSNETIEIVNGFIRKLSKEGNKELFSDLTYRGIRYGDAIYAYLLRKTFISFDGKQIRLREKFIEAFLMTFHLIDMAYELFSNNDFETIIIGEWGYIYGLIARVGQEHNAQVLCPNITRPNFIVKIESNRKLFDDVKMEDMTKCIGDYDDKEEYSNENMFVLDREQYKSEIDVIRNDKPNVFVLAHALTDNSRVGDHYDLFYDNYDWFISTMNIIKSKHQYNWYIKDHPESRQYRQERVMRDIYEKYACDNIIWFDKHYSGDQIALNADCVVTCAGDPGMEFWAYGIPTISAAHAFYVDWGISYNAKTIQEYEQLLDGSGELEKPSDSSKAYAKKMINKARKGFDDSIDDVCSVFFRTRKKVLCRFRDGERMKNDIYYDFSQSLARFNKVEDYSRIASKCAIIC